MKQLVQPRLDLSFLTYKRYNAIKLMQRKYRKLRQIHGFTIIEIVVVIAVIGILATIVAVGYGNWKRSTVESQIKSDLTHVASAMEDYRTFNNGYPTSVPNTFTPSGGTVLSGGSYDSGATYCIDGTSSEFSGFEYYIDSSRLTATEGTCASRPAPVNPPTQPNGLVASATSPSSIDVTWNTSTGADSYVLERATNSGFSDTQVAATPTGASANVTGLASATTYYFRVKAVNSGGSSSWSSSAYATTSAFIGMGLGAVADSNSQITLTWTQDPSATDGYNIDYSTNQAFSTFTPIHGISQSTTSRVVSGLSTGVHYYFRGQSVAGGTYGPWSYADATTYVPVPGSISATTNSSTQITASWSSVSVADTYTLEYSTDVSFAPASTSSITGITATSQAATGLNQGKTYYFRVYALVGTTPSAASATANATTSVSTPGAPGVAASQPGAVRTCAAGSWIKYPQYCPNNYYATGWITSTSCPSGTTPIYQMSARYNSPTTKYYTGSTTTSQWYFEAASGGYYTLWAGQYYCKGANANSSWGPWSSEVST